MTIRLEPPAPGMMVEVRGRHYVVSNVRRSELPTDPMALLRQSEPNHIVELSSVEDDGLGEELQVIWEVEPGVRPYERLELPEPNSFDTPARLDAFIDAVRWGAVSSADVKALQSPFRSGIEIEDYQLDPVVRSLQMPRVNLLIGDGTGLGKTIEAGLVAQELVLRHRVRTILIICPASLVYQWRDQMLDKFGLEFRVVDSELMKTLRRSRGLHVNPWSHFPRLITSIDFLKRERPMRLFREVLPAEGESIFPRRFDLMIVDEAHNVAPSGAGRYATDSLRTTAIRALAPHFEHKLFLTATPHNGYQESFSALLELVDDQRFARGVEPDRKQLAAIMVRRLKDELTKRWDGTSRFASRDIVPIEVAYTDEERRAHGLLEKYAALRRKNAASQEEVFASEFVLKLLKKRMFSSPQAFLSTLETHERSIASAKKRAAIRKLKRQRDSMLYQRVGLSKDKDAVLALAKEGRLIDSPDTIFRDPMVMEFLGLEQRVAYDEPDLEKAILNHLEAFMRELGRDFCFVDRQLPIRVGNEVYHLDLLFFHRGLRCLIAIDLKIGRFKHTDAGQMNFYLNYIREEMTKDDEQPPIGLLLCADKDEETVYFATGGLENDIRVSRYKLELPSEEELRAFLKREQQFIESQKERKEG